MNVFEDLIEELKEENLIEETVIETAQSELNQNSTPPTAENQFAASKVEAENYETPPRETYGQPSLEPKISDYYPEHAAEFAQTELPPIEPAEELTGDTPNFETFDEQSLDDFDYGVPEPAVLNEFEISADLSHQPVETPADLPRLDLENNPPFPEIITEAALVQPAAPQYAEPVRLSDSQPTEKDFYRRRATEEVNSLQIVEHIVTAIEREQMKMIPKPYDDIAVSMALHDFLKVADQLQSSDHAQAEFKLMQETESWYSALSHRDKHISIGDLRRYCENTKPALSGQALISLARFYRNSPFSETVRSKFDVVVTRLLTKELPDNTRELLFDRDGLMKQLSGLYADWSSIPLYDSDNDSDVLIGVLKLEDFINEAADSRTFEELIKNDFFNRVRLFKEGMGEKFFSPILVAAAIECNVAIGNKYVQLIDQERERNNARLVQEKYSFVLDQPVSDATSKTLQLVELLKEKNGESSSSGAPRKDEVKETLKMDSSTRRYTPREAPAKKKLLGLSNWVWILNVTLTLGLGGLIVYVEYFTPPMKTSPTVRKVNLDNSSLKEYFKTARINRDTFFAVTEPAWDKLSKDVKEDVLKKTLAVGSEKGYNKIHLLNSEGKTVGFATEKGIDLDPK